GWRDSNSRHPAPKAGALPGYATPRGREYSLIKGLGQIKGAILGPFDFFYLRRFGGFFMA
ncbi:MAG: hypothetical protein RL241_386, partial [Pseudomonadota bacterium]